MEHGIYEPTDGQEYTTFNSLILQAASETSTKLKHENKVWFNHSLAKILPVITNRDNLLHLLRHTDPSNFDSIREIKHDLKLAQNNVTDSIDLAKARWSAFQAARIHKMIFTPKEAWKGVKILVGGKESHHIKPVMMRLCLSNGELASTDEQNSSSWDHISQKNIQTTALSPGR